jgi:hypothetical protein
VARNGIARYLEFFNAWRPQAALDRRTLDTVYSVPSRTLVLWGHL